MIPPPVGCRLLSVLLPLLALAASVVPAAVAQEPGLSPRATLNGVVIDAASGAELPGAMVILIEQADPVIADEQGRFDFSDVQLGTRTLIVTQIGYDSLRTEVEFTGPDVPVVVSMTPDPVALERITVMVDSFERRRASLGSSVRVLDRLALQTSSAFSVLDLVRTRASIVPTPCRSRLAMTPCAFVRGRVIPVAVSVDGARMISGIDVLATMPPHDLYLIEVIGGGQAIRAYTTWYVQTVARGRIPAEVFFSL